MPFRIKTFGLRVFLNKTVTKDQLLKRGILTSSNDKSCVLRFQAEENVDHLFYNCQVVNKVWELVEDWLGISLRREGQAWRNFLLCSGELRKKSIKKGKEGIMWFALIWCIWNHRNEILELKCNFLELVWSIKFKMWKWSLIGDIHNPTVIFVIYVRIPIISSIKLLLVGNVSCIRDFLFFCNRTRVPQYSFNILLAYKKSVQENISK